MRIRTVRRNRPAPEALEGRALLTAGALDTTFGGTGQVTTVPITPFAVRGCAVQSDLKTLVVGINAPTSGPANLELIRYNQDGSLDTTFGNGGAVLLATNSAPTYRQNPVAIQSDGKIVVSTTTEIETTTTTKTKHGTTTTTTITAKDMMVLRLNPDGSLDTTFGSGGEAVIKLPSGSAYAEGVAALPGGQIVVAGSNAPNYAGPAYVVARLTSNGALDTTFGPNGQGYNDVAAFTSSSSTTNTEVDAFAVDPSGNLLLGGVWDPSGASNSFDARLVRFTPGGLLDPTFANNGVDDNIMLGKIQGIGLQSSGDIVVSVPYASAVHVVRLNPSGAVDTTFGTNGEFTDASMAGSYCDLVVQPDDKVVFEAKSAAQNALLIDRLMPGGTPDPAFGSAGQVSIVPPTGTNMIAPMGIIIGPDGKITTAAVATDTIRLLNDITSNTRSLAPVATSAAVGAAGPDSSMPSSTTTSPSAIIAPTSTPTSAPAPGLVAMILDGESAADFLLGKSRRKLR